MPRFFVDKIKSENIEIFGEDARHITKSLRMKKGEKLTICDKNQMEFNCEIKVIDGEKVSLKVLSKNLCETEPPLSITLFQALPKGDKMDLIIQKSVEIGAFEIVPILTSRCISRPDDKSIQKKLIRWNKISKEAAEQSGRGLIPKVQALKSFQEVSLSLNEFDQSFVFYEKGGDSLYKSLSNKSKKIAIIIGPEGGFEESEINELKEKGAIVSTLGKRILRAETAPLVALANLIFLKENFNFI